MRLPLFETGTPFLLSGGGVSDIFFTLEDLPEVLQSRVRGVTLYAYGFTSDPDGGEANLNIGSNDLDNNTFTQIGGYHWLVDNLNPQVLPVKVLDAFPVRGNERLFIQQDSPQGDPLIYVWGYYEIEGARDLPHEYRPLQPSLTQVAANYGGKSYATANPVNDVVHRFAANYIDVVDLYLYNVAPDTALTINGTMLPLLTPPDVFAYKFFDGIPFRPDSVIVNAGNNTINFVSADTQSDPAFVWGRFLREA